jgi:hypothetical protein
LRLIRFFKFPIPYTKEIIPNSVNLQLNILYEKIFYFFHQKGL